MVGLERGQGGARAPVLRRPAGRHPPGQLRAGLLRSGAGAPRRRARRARRRRSGRRWSTLLEHSARAHGVGTAKDLGDYFRLPIKAVRPLLEEMADDGRRGPGRGRGLEAARLRPPRRARCPAGSKACALVSPVRLGDVGARPGRAGLRLPLPHRDLRAEAEAGLRLLRAAVPARRPLRRPRRPQGRPGRRRRCSCSRRSPRTASTTSRWPSASPSELRTMAGWLGLDDVVVKDRGDLAPTLQLFV